MSQECDCNNPLLDLGEERVGEIARLALDESCCAAEAYAAHHIVDVMQAKLVDNNLCASDFIQSRQ